MEARRGRRGSGGADTPVGHRVRFAGDLFTLRENRCQRTDPATAAAEIVRDEVVLPSKGLWVRHERGRSARVAPGSLHYFERGSSHLVSHPDGCGDVNTGIEFEPANVLGDGVAILRREPGRRGTSRWMSARARLAQAMLEVALAQAAQDALEIEEACVELVGAALAPLRHDVSAHGDAPLARRSARHAELADAVGAYLGVRFRQAPRLAEVARAVRASAGHVARVFRAETGMSIHAHRRALQVADALHVLAGNGATLYDAVAASGFADRIQLHRAFRAVLGCSPGRAARELASRRGRARLLARAAPPPVTNCNRRARGRP